MPRTTTIIDLRQRAEARLQSRTGSTGPISRELELHKLELEMQNDELRRIQHELETARDRYRDLFEAAPVPYLSLDRDGRIVAANRAACRLVGSRTDELAGIRLAKLLRREDGDRLYRALPTVSARHSRRLDVELVTASGHRGARLDVSLGEGNQYLVVIHEGQLAVATPGAQPAVTCMGASTSAIAHEINNLLQVLQAAFENLQLTVAEPAQRRCIRVGLDTLDRTKDMVGRLSAHGRRAPVVGEDAMLDDVVAETVELLRPLFDASFSITLDLGCGGHRVTTDRSAIEIVLTNLLVNARDAMRGGGELAIATRDVTRGNQACAVLVVEDSGEGMTEEIQRHIFEPFFTTKPAGKGTGLGLATSRDLVQHAGGSMTVTSTLGVGTTFRIELPIADERRFALGTGARPKVRLTSELATILIVEANAVARSAMSEHLNALGYAVRGLADADAALELARGTRFDLAILDVRLRTMSGSLLAHHLRDIHPGLRVLLTSGYPKDFVPSGEGFLQKPFTLDALTDAVSAQLASR